MDSLDEKVKKQTEMIEEGIVTYKAAIMTLKQNWYRYDSKELEQKTTILQGFIDVLQMLKIKQ